MQSSLAYPAQAIQEINAGNTPAAIKFLESVLQACPEDLASLHLMAILKLQIFRPDEALPLLEKATSLGSQEGVIYHHLAHCLAFLDRDEEAEKNFFRALELRGPNLDTELALGHLYLKMRKFKEALGMSEGALQKHPDSGGARHLFQESLDGIKLNVESAIYRNYGPLFIVSQPHSAGNYVHAELTRRLNACPRKSIVVDLQSSIIRENLEYIVKNGGIGLDHVHPKEENLIVLHHSGLKKLVVQVRDPRQAVYSTTLWYDHIKERASTPGWPQHEVAVMESRLPTGYYSWPLEKKLDFMIETELPYTVDWLSRWHAASTDLNWNFRIKISKHEDMKKNPEEFFGSIADFYALPRAALQGEIRDSKPGVNGQPGEHAFRKGSPDEWRHSLSPAQIARVNELAPPEFLEKFGWTV